MTTHTFQPSVQAACVVLAILLGVLILPLPAAVYLLVKRRRGRVDFDGLGFEARSLGPLPARWDYADIERLGVLRITVSGGGIGGALARQLNGATPAVTLVAKLKGGRTRTLMISRFTDGEAILRRVQARTGLLVESVTTGLVGPRWPAPGG